MMIIEEIKKVARPGTKIPKPISKDDYIVSGWVTSKGEDALKYLIGERQHPKYIRVSEFKAAYDMLSSSGEFTRKWFNENLPESAREWCNFTTIGGIFELLGVAEHLEEGGYRKIK